MNVKTNGKFVLLMVLALSLVTTSALVNSAAATPGDKAIPLIHVYLYYPNGKPAQVKITVAFGDDKYSKTVNTKDLKMETKTISGTPHTGAEVEMKLPMKTRGWLPDVFSVCTTNLTTQEKRCEYPYVWWADIPTDAWIRVYNTT